MLRTGLIFEGHPRGSSPLVSIGMRNAVLSVRLIEDSPICSSMMPLIEWLLKSTPNSEFS
jgi:hypothetical protein